MDEGLEDKAKNKTNKPVVDSTKAIESLTLRILMSQRRHAIEGASFKNSVRCYLFALEAKDLGLKAEDIK